MEQDNKEARASIREKPGFLGKLEPLEGAHFHSQIQNFAIKMNAG